MENVKLVEICNPKQWKTLSTQELIENGEFPVYGANGIIGYYNSYNHENETVLITCRGATCGNVHISKKKSYVNGNAMALDDLNEEICNKKYLYYYLKNYDMNEVISGSAQPQITRQGLKRIIVKLYNLDKQKEIVNILDRIQEIMDLRKKQIEELDGLIKSQFVEMFGTPFINEKKWKTGNIKDLVNEVRYGTSRLATKGGKHKYLRMNNITYDGKLDLSDLKYIDIPEKELDKCTTRNGDILFNRTNSRELVGKTCVYNMDERMVIAGFIIRIRVNKNANPYFISTYLNTKYLKEKLYSMCKNASGQSNINAQELQKIEIYMPPIELQNNFAEIVKQINKHKIELENSLKGIESLQESLINKYFGG